MRIVLFIIIVFLGMTIKEFKIIPGFSVDFLAGWTGSFLFHDYLNNKKKKRRNNELSG